MRYRSEIDGLRAFAVTSVLLFHAGIRDSGPTFVPGGHFGVDIFFVLSGYLISRILFDEIDATGRLKLWTFYERRARRILPALVAVMLLCLPAVLVISTNGDSVDFRNSAMAALLSVSNLYFLVSTTDYNAGNAQLLPLLHTWSLGVEWQFYLVFPFVTLAIGRFAPRLRGAVVAGLGLASFLLCLWMLPRDPDLTFYLPLTRFWELLAGSLVAALQGRNLLPARLAAPLALAAGLALLAVVFVPKEVGHHPGLLTLVPVLGTALLLVTATEGSAAQRVLSFAPFLWLGRISYSAYLIHFPLLAFARQLLSEPPEALKLGLVALAIGLAAVSYRLVEQPFRNPRRKGTGRMLGELAAGAAVLVGASVWLARPDGAANAFKLLAPVQGEISASFDTKALQAEADRLSRTRTAFSDLAKLNVLIVGNSHSRSATNAFTQNAHLWPNAEFLRERLQISCFDPDMAENRPIAKAFFAEPFYAAADVVVIATRYSHTQTCDEGPNAPAPLRDDKGLAGLLDRLKRDGKKAVVIGPSVEFKGGDVDATLYAPLRRQLILGNRDKLEQDADFARRIADGINARAFRLRLGQPELFGAIRQIALSAGAEFVDITPFLCDAAAKMCHAMTPKQERGFADTNHLTVAASAYLGERLAAAGLPATFASAR